MSLSTAKLDSVPRWGGEENMHLGHLSPHPWREAGRTRELEPMLPSECFKLGIWRSSRAKLLVRSYFFSHPNGQEGFLQALELRGLTASFFS